MRLVTGLTGQEESYKDKVKPFFVYGFGLTGQQVYIFHPLLFSRTKIFVEIQKKTLRGKSIYTNKVFKR